MVGLFCYSPLFSYVLLTNSVYEFFNFSLTTIMSHTNENFASRKKLLFSYSKIKLLTYLNVTVSLFARLLKILILFDNLLKLT